MSLSHNLNKYIRAVESFNTDQQEIFKNCLMERLNLNLHDYRNALDKQFVGATVREAARTVKGVTSNYDKK